MAEMLMGDDDTAHKVAAKLVESTDHLVRRSVELARENAEWRKLVVAFWLLGLTWWPRPGTSTATHTQCTAALCFTQCTRCPVPPPLAGLAEPSALHVRVCVMQVPGGEALHRTRVGHLRVCDERRGARARAPSR